MVQMTADELAADIRSRLTSDYDRKALDRYVADLDAQFNRARRVDQLKARRLTAAAATAAAIALATPAAAEPLPPVATDDAVIATSDATDRDTFRLPPAWTGPGYAPDRPDLSRDRWLMCGAFAFDGATTIYAIERGAVESAPMTKLVLGKRPGPAEVMGFMAAKCGAFLALGSLVEGKDTRLARLFYRLNIGISAAAGANNIRVGLRIKL